MAKRLWRGHTTPLTYLALFIALGGTGWAATHPAGDESVVAHLAGAHGVKVHCSATSNGKKVTCKVVRGRFAGPPGPRGPAGPPGPKGSSGGGISGPTTLTQQPGFALVQGGISNAQVGVNSPATDTTNGEWQRNNVYSYSQVASPATLVFRLSLLSPSELAGSAVRLASVDFCYGLQDSTLAASPPAHLSITRATVREFVEPDATTSGPVPVYSTPPTLLIDAPLNVTTTSAGSNGCQTVSATSNHTITPGGYMALDLQVSFTAPNTPNGHPAQGWLYFGRVTTTYAP